MAVSRHSGRNLAIIFVVLVIFLLVLPNQAVATDGGLSLPSTPIRIEVTNGTESYFLTRLSYIPSGCDVVNGTYLGWCVDVRTEMARSPATHEVRLYSSGSPPAELGNERWDMVNYILNHKEGTSQDVQQAIWYFVHIGGSYSLTRAVALAIVNDTLLYGNGFAPTEGEAAAVICYPTILFPAQSDVQISIIEVRLSASGPVGGYSFSMSKHVTTETLSQGISVRVILAGLVGVRYVATGRKKDFA